MKRALLFASLFAAVVTTYPLAAAGPAIQLKTKFDATEHDPYLKPGTGVITGQAFLRQKGGGVVTCAGSEVILVPATPFFREIFDLNRKGKQAKINDHLDPAYRPIVKRGQCDAQGNFSFQNIPTGNWFIHTDVRWEVGYAQQGGCLMREITISIFDDAPLKVLLSDKDRHQGRW